MIPIGTLFWKHHTSVERDKLKHCLFGDRVRPAANLIDEFHVDARTASCRRAQEPARSERLVVPPHVSGYLDENCGADRWALTPAGARGVLNDAIMQLGRGSRLDAVSQLEDHPRESVGFYPLAPARPRYPDAQNAISIAAPGLKLHAIAVEAESGRFIQMALVQVACGSKKFAD